MRKLNSSIIFLIFFMLMNWIPVQAQELNKDKIYKDSIDDVYGMINLPLPPGNWFVQDMALGAPEEKGFYLFTQLRSDDKFYADTILLVISDKDSIETEYRKEYKVCTHPTNATEFQIVQNVTDIAPGIFEEFCAAKGNDIDPALGYTFYIADCNENCVEVSWFSFNKKLKSSSDQDFKSMSDQVIGAFRDGFNKKQSSLAFSQQYIAK